MSCYRRRTSHRQHFVYKRQHDSSRCVNTTASAATTVFPAPFIKPAFQRHSLLNSLFRHPSLPSRWTLPETMGRFSVFGQQEPTLDEIHAQQERRPSVVEVMAASRQRKSVSDKAVTGASQITMRQSILP